MAPTISEGLEFPTRSTVDRLLTGPGGPFEMETAEIDGQAVRVYKSTLAHLGAVFDRARMWKDREYLVYQNERLTYGAHHQRVCALARELVQTYGVRKGDRVAIAMRNLPEWSVSFWAVVTIGAIAVPLNAWWTGPELTYAINDSGARVLLSDPERYERVRPHLSPGQVQVVLARCENAGHGTRSMESIFANSAQSSESGWSPGADLQPDDAATIFYTSGTTGRPKGALSSHRAVCLCLSNIGIARARAFLREGYTLQQFLQTATNPSTALLAVPLFHLIGCFAHLVSAMERGGKLVLLHKWDAGEALELMEKEKVNSFTGVPTIVAQALEHARNSGRDLSSLQAVGFSGAPAPSELSTQIASVVPQSIAGNGYGLTEASGLVTAIWGRDYINRPRSVGFPLPAVDVKIVGAETGLPIPEGEVGEVLVRSAGALGGYWNNPQATEAALSGGWLRTGDLGRFDASGCLYIVDRKKDIIIRGGENVYSIEIENALAAHSDVMEVAVIGIPHPQLGEEVAAVVRARPGSKLTAEDLTAYAAKRLAQYKVPSRIFFTEIPLPRNAVGKILKSELRHS